jgi:predicted nucleotidyltransferase
MAETSKVLREALDDLGAVEVAFVYGSVAAGDEDLRSDVDLMLIGCAGHL